MYNALNQAKQVEAVKREFQAAWENGQYGLAGRIAEANPDLRFEIPQDSEFIKRFSLKGFDSPQTIHEALGGR